MSKIDDKGRTPPHRHHPGCGCSAPHPLFGLGVAAAIVAVALAVIGLLA